MGLFGKKKKGAAGQVPRRGAHAQQTGGMQTSALASIGSGGAAGPQVPDIDSPISFRIDNFDLVCHNGQWSLAGGTASFYETQINIFKKDNLRLKEENNILLCEIEILKNMAAEHVANLSKTETRVTDADIERAHQLAHQRTFDTARTGKYSHSRSPSRGRRRNDDTDSDDYYSPKSYKSKSPSRRHKDRSSSRSPNRSSSRSPSSRKSPSRGRGHRQRDYSDDSD